MNLCLEPKFIRGTYFNCGHCRSCRLSRRLEWTQRLVHEGVSYGQKAVFITLTYKNECLPKNYSLRTRDLQLFFKRLRKRLSYLYPDVTNIRYYACGEYCPTTQRPHYHAVIFGLDSRHRQLIFDCWGKCKYAYYDFSLVKSRKAYAYTAGYTSKKIGTGWRKKEKETGRKSPFSVMSQGIGKNYALHYSDQFKKHPFDRVKGKEVLIPRYYRKILGVSTEQILPWIKQKTAKFIISVQNTLGIPKSTAERHVLFNGPYLVRMRLECNERLRKIEEQWRMRRMLAKPTPLGV